MRIQIGQLIPEEAKPGDRSRAPSRPPLPVAKKKCLLRTTPAGRLPFIGCSSSAREDWTLNLSK
jgi:hypothetical protein